ncbi:glycosyl hydrolase family 32 [Naasia sp. SYSU D00948]|uniref:glycosyl hydrolase family 32 n=1 Tax=Naasia sp. SYSU D00948 TaxID=2817379 RepID=UPI001B3023F9|nr:glycosyl hydrolase family 32 [Naasia sp. SYSU D00948]
MFRLTSSWVWDFWFADDGETYHLYFLKASRALVDPDRRHLRASIGHATSRDLVEWTEEVDAIVPADEPAWDDRATWTGSVVHDGGTWRMFYTGVDRRGHGLVQRIGMATSPDLYSWTKPDPPLVLEADPRWYETLEQDAWRDEAWRDPWVFRGDDGWHMLITARARTGDPAERGVVGHARSDDLVEWTVLPPASEPGSGFGQLEVTQLAEVDGRRVLLFSCGGQDLSEPGRRGGVWAVNVSGAGVGPFDVRSAYRLADESVYVGRLVQRRDGGWAMLAFRNEDVDGRFVGEITDPLPVGWQDGRLTLLTDEEPRAVPAEARRAASGSLPGRD